MKHLITLLIAVATAAGQCETLTTVAPDDPMIDFAGYVHKELIAAPDNPDRKLVRFDRTLDMPGTGYRWDNPGVCIRFRTDATTIEAFLNYNELHQSKTARNGAGACSVDGVIKPEHAFQSQARSVLRSPELVRVDLSPGRVQAPVFHDYEIFLPYADSVDFAGLKVNPEARFEPMKARAATRYVAYGDSITQGFAASTIDNTYPFLIGKAKGWETIDLGFGGRSSFPAPADADVLASLKPEVVTVLLGVNDWMGNVPLERYGANMEKFLSTLRAALPQTSVYLLTPLWVPPNWSHPSGQENDLDFYRQILRDIVAAGNDPNLHLIEGPDLIDPDASLFDRVAVHPNDDGFAMMAERLATQMEEPASGDPSRGAAEDAAGKGEPVVRQ